MKLTKLFAICLCAFIGNNCCSEESSSYLQTSRHSDGAILSKSRLSVIELMEQLLDNDLLNEMAEAAGVSKDIVHDNRLGKRLYDIVAIRREELVYSNKSLQVIVETAITYKAGGMTFNEASALCRRVHNYVGLRFSGLEHEEALRRALQDSDALNIYMRNP